MMAAKHEEKLMYVMLEGTGAKPVRGRRAARSGERPPPHMRSRRAVGLDGLHNEASFITLVKANSSMQAAAHHLVLVGYQGPNRYHAPASRPLGGDIAPPKVPCDFRSAARYASPHPKLYFRQ